MSSLGKAARIGNSSCGIGFDLRSVLAREGGYLASVTKTVADGETLIENGDINQIRTSKIPGPRARTSKNPA
jgi:hypothetical protein